jgi:uncharacterized protein (TIGR03437 family)
MMRHIVLLGWVAVLMPAFGQTYMVSTIGGRGKLPYVGDGQNAAAAELFYPDRLAYDAAGNLYFAESYYNRVFRVAAADGKLTTAAGNGQTGFSGDHGLATAAALEGPEGIAVDGAGNLYIGVGARLCKVTVDGRIQVIAGTGDSSYSGDGKPAVSATFDTPVAIALNSSGTVVYFSDETHDVVRKIDAAGIITTVAGTGSPGYSNDGQPGSTAKLNSLEGLAVDSNGNLYIADRFNNRIRKVRPDGTITTFAGTGVAGASGDGLSPTLGNLFQPTDVVVDPNNDVFIADMSNGRVKLVDVQTGQMSNLTLQMVSVDDLAYNPGPAGGLAATDFLQHAIFSISVPAGSISQHPIAGTLHTTAIGDNGPASGAVFLDPYGVAVDGKGNVFVADFADQRVRRIGTDLTITTVAGTGVFGNSNNGGAATAAQIAQPMGIAVDASGNVYFTASCEVRVIQSNGNIASVAGNGGNCGYAGNNILSSSAQLYFPQGLAVDSKSQFLYISDTDNNRIRKVNLVSSIITTLAGNGQQGYAGNGTDALSATMDTPVGIAVDSKGNVYFADQNNNRVRKIATDGNIYDVAGTGTPGNDGDGGPAVAASLAWPTGLAVDPSDNLYVTSSGYIRRISTDGSIATIAGTGWTDFSGDGDLATLADMDPWYVAVDGNGRIYFSDENNLRIRRLDPVQIYPSGVVNGATYQRGPVAPGEVIVIFGSGLGPAQIAQASLDAAGPPVPTSLGGAQIAFDGVRAPLLYVSAAQASAIVPFAVAGKSSTVMQVAYQDKTTNAISMAVSPASPGLFTVAQNGSGQGCILNQDYSLNSAANSAARGDIVMIWGTGGGPTVPASMDGQFTTGTYPTIPPPVTATIGGVDAEVIWAGAAPGMVAGINQFNVRVPSGAASGNNVPIILKVGSVASPASATLAVK